MIEKLDSYYKNSYERICNSGSIGFVSNVIHILIERGKVKGSKLKDFKDLRIIEVGAGHGQHRPFVKNYREYIETDLRPENLPPPNKYKDKPIDCTNLPFQESEFDRLIATCLLAHLVNPEKALKEWKRVVKNDGIISIYVPCEPGIFLRLIQNIATRRKQKKLESDAYLTHYLDHRSHYPALKCFILHEFGEMNVQNKRYPFNFLTWNFNLFSIMTINVQKDR
jgi:phosphatidylethanolamine/phosphatidyl-N-methylethanolamine N-methyltransferase